MKNKIYNYCFLKKENWNEIKLNASERGTGLIYAYGATFLKKKIGIKMHRFPNAMCLKSNYWKHAVKVTQSEVKQTKAPLGGRSELAALYLFIYFFSIGIRSS